MLKDIQENMALMQKEQHRISAALFGDKEAKVKGVFDKVDDHDRDIRKFKMFGVFAGGAILGWPAVWEAIKNAFKH